jgi:hypothetical protein
MWMTQKLRHSAERRGASQMYQTVAGRGTCSTKVSPHTTQSLLGKRDAQRACCTNARSAQRFWVPLGTQILLHECPIRAARVLHEDGSNAIERPGQAGRLSLRGWFHHDPGKSAELVKRGSLASGSQFTQHGTEQ